MHPFIYLSTYLSISPSLSLYIHIYIHIYIYTHTANLDYDPTSLRRRLKASTQGVSLRCILPLKLKRVRVYGLLRIGCGRPGLGSRVKPYSPKPLNPKG